MKINYALVSRSLIALLFVVAGLGKIMNFAGAKGMIESLGLPLAGLVTLVVILIEVPVALSFAWGYRVCITGWTLIGFTALATLFAHRHISDPTNMIMALKNIAIIGGIMLAIRECDCGTCPTGKKDAHQHHNHNHQ
jgi:putative oxidoreductase